MNAPRTECVPLCRMAQRRARLYPAIISRVHTRRVSGPGTHRRFSIGQSWKHRASSTWPVIGCKWPGLPGLFSYNGQARQAGQRARKSKTNRESDSPGCLLVSGWFRSIFRDHRRGELFNAVSSINIRRERERERQPLENVSTASCSRYRT